jgi:hypothetical protein
MSISPPDPPNDEWRQNAQDKLEAMLTEGIQSSEPTLMTGEDWAEIRRDALRNFEARKSRESAAR